MQCCVPIEIRLFCLVSVPGPRSGDGRERNVFSGQLHSAEVRTHTRAHTHAQTHSQTHTHLTHSTLTNTHPHTHTARTHTHSTHTALTQRRRMMERDLCVWNM